MLRVHCEERVLVPFAICMVYKVTVPLEFLTMVTIDMHLDIGLGLRAHVLKIDPDQVRITISDAIDFNRVFTARAP